MIKTAATPSTAASPAARPTLSPRLFQHPLMGSNLSTLLALFLKNGFGRYPFHFLVLVSVALLRWPFSTYEQWQVSRDRVSEQQPPIFILGHWRSGTTFLNNVLSRSPQFAYLKPIATGLPWDFLTIGRALEPLLHKALPEGRFIDNVPVEPDSPQEDEIALASMQTLSFYHGLYFPKRFVEYFNAGIFLEGASQREIRRWEKTVSHFYKKLHIQDPGKQLLIKNPVYTARVAQLRKLFPTAKFIHIYRNPYRVFQSTENFYRKLFPEIAFQSFYQVPIREVILSSYPKMMNALYRDVEDLSEESFIEFKFETFEANPIAQLQTVYAQLGLPHWEADKLHFQAYLSAQKNYKKNKYAFSQESIELVSDRWQPFLSRWHYQPPETPH